MKAKIHPSNLDKFNAKIKILNKRVDKINSLSDQKLPLIIVSNVVEVPAKIDEYGKVKEKPYISFDIEGFDNEIKFNGWSFVGVIDHIDNGDNILRAAPKKEIPESYIKSTGNCDHCKSKRSRKSTAIIYNESTNEYKQCGLQCVSYYTLSIKAEYYIRLYKDLLDTICGMSDGFGINCDPTLQSILIHTAFCAERFGIVSKSSEKVVSTRDRVYGSFTSKFENQDHKNSFINTFGSYPINITDDHVAKAKLAIEWISSKEQSNAFYNNLKAVSKMQFINDKHFGLACWIMLCYLQEVEKQEKLRIEFEKRQNIHLGIVGEKIDVEAECVKSIFLYDNQFGIVYLNVFRTKEGNTIVWRTSKQFEKNSMYKISSKVHAHTEFKETKQTEIKRAKVTKFD